MQEDHLQEALVLLKKLPHHRSKSEIDMLVELTQELPFFRQYNKQENGQFIHRECCKHMFAEKLLEGDIVFHVDSVGTKFYVILDGQVEVLIKRRGFDELESVRILRKGESFGELALIHRQPRLATIRCVSDCAFAVLDKQQFQQILHYEQTKKIEQNVDYFSQISIFNSLNRAQLTQIYLNSFLYDYEKGQYVVHEGDKSDSFLIIKSGLFQVRKAQQKSRSLILFEIGELQVFGFYHLYNKVPYEYSLICLTAKGSVYKIHRTSLIEKIFESHSTDLEKHMLEMNNYAHFKVNQEESTQKKYPNYFHIKTTTEIKQNTSIDKEWKKQLKPLESKAENTKSRNSLIKQKIDNIIQSNKRKQHPQSLAPKDNSLYNIFLQSHKGIRNSAHIFRQQSPSVLESPHRQFGCSWHLYNTEELNPFLTVRSSSPVNNILQFNNLKTTGSQKTIIKPNKQCTAKYKFQEHMGVQQYDKPMKMSLTPEIIKIKVHKL